MSKLTLESKIHLAIFVNVILAILIGEYLVLRVLDLSGAVGISVNIAFNCAVAFFYGRFVSRRITQPLRRVSGMLEDINEGHGDLTQRLPIESEDEIGHLSRTFNSFLDKLHDIMVHIAEVTHALSTSVAYFNHMAEQVTENATSQTTRTEQVAQDMDSMSARVTEVAEGAVNVKQGAEMADSSASKGADAVRETIQGMTNVRSAVEATHQTMISFDATAKQINEVTGLIDNVAEQTNLLALNAAIEAARAGDHGRGFAVVADQVRSLASQTSEATKDITKWVQAIQQKSEQIGTQMGAATEQANEAVDLANEAGERLRDIETQSQMVTNMLDEISSSVVQQSRSARSIASTVDEVATSARSSGNSVQQVVKFSRDLQDQVVYLHSLIEQFKLDEGSASRDR